MTAQSRTPLGLMESLVNLQIDTECSRLPPSLHRATAYAVATRFIPLDHSWHLVRATRHSPPHVRIET